ncbi:hypothetical protein SORBI_3003G160300 [Sorghum bicolor]|uniref:Uncharacterized protein n=1 Tax=Sorghum bicolor TaxID=4558 RepID=A0A1B6Q3J6_SORBI|nr:hypothetical protein SORBI_3003G160300 [Sorghum bicolor]
MLQIWVENKKNSPVLGIQSNRPTHGLLHKTITTVRCETHTDLVRRLLKRTEESSLQGTICCQSSNSLLTISLICIKKIKDFRHGYCCKPRCVAVKLMPLKSFIVMPNSREFAVVFSQIQ